LYLAYDGVDAIHVARTAPLVDPHLGLAFPLDVPAVPESIIGGVSSSPIRECVCPPGGIAADPRTGTAPGAGSIYISYSRQNGKNALGQDVGGGVGVARSDDHGLTWSYFSIPGTGSTGSAFDTQYNFAPIKVDSAGNVYVAWGEGQNIKQDSNGNDIATGGVAIKYAFSTTQGQTWSTPVTVSTTNSNVFPTMDVASPGVVQIAYYGSNFKGDPNLAPSSTSWNVYEAATTSGLSTNPSFKTQVAIQGMHDGCIQVGSPPSSGLLGLTPVCSDRNLLDFFQLVSYGGLPNIVYTAGDEAHGTNLFFTQATGTTTTPTTTTTTTTTTVSTTTTTTIPTTTTTTRPRKRRH
jgi:hypothetical protein